MMTLPMVLYSNDGKTLERFSPDLEDTVFIVPETVEHIAEEAFYGCSNTFGIWIFAMQLVSGQCRYRTKKSVCFRSH